MDIKKKEKKINYFKAACRENGLKITPQRIIIYEELISQRLHPSAGEVHEKIHRRFPNISFDTVNRALNTFTGVGIIKTVESFDGVKRFDSDPGQHHHLLCVKCNKIIDFYSKEYDSLSIPVSIKKKHKIIGKRVVLEGVCERCRKKKKEGRDA
ncbi:MAG: Fur family transcriptional regulator [Elusimicrobiota bacterium]|nr:Fur family transcriptional regulator [Elusimicrobiota bacterium]